MAGQWPPAYESAAGQLAAGSFPPPGLPSAGTLDYLQKGLTVLVLLLGMPWLIARFFRNPSRTAAAAGRKHLAE